MAEFEQQIWLTGFEQLNLNWKFEMPKNICNGKPGGGGLPQGPPQTAANETSFFECF